MEIKEFKIPTHFGNIAVVASGNPDKKPLIAIHGWLDNAATFNELTPFIAEHFYVLAVDLPGHGLSSHRSQDAYGYYFQDWAIDLALVVKHFDLRDYYLMGHSMGAAVCTFFSVLTDNKPTALIALDGLTPLFDSDDNTFNRMKTYFNYVVNHYSSEKKPVEKKFTLETAIKLRMNAEIILPLSTAENICKRQLQEGADGLGSWRNDLKLKWPSAIRMNIDQIKSMLKKLDVPLHLIHGTQSPFKDLHFVLKRYLNEFESYTLHPVDTQHYPHSENPELVANILKQTLT